jgi:hypothetical protein
LVANVPYGRERIGYCHPKYIDARGRLLKSSLTQKDQSWVVNHNCKLVRKFGMWANKQHPGKFAILVLTKMRFEE